MTILLTFLLFLFALTVLLLAGSIVLQSWLYNAPANRIVIRSLAAGAGLALFFTVWTALDAKSPGKFVSIFEPTDDLTQDFDKVTSMRKARGKEEAIVFRRQSQGGKIQYFDTRTGRADKFWTRSDADGIVVALLVQEEGKTDPTRFEVKLENNTFTSDGVYYEVGGKRYIDPANIGRVVTPRGGSLFLKLLISALHFAAWFTALWVGMQFASGHAIGIGFSLWLFMMLLVMPVVFQNTRPAPETKLPTPKAVG